MTQQTRNSVGAALLALLFFAWLAHEVAIGQTLAFDLLVRDTVHSWAWPPLTAVMRAITETGDPTVLALIALIVVWRLAATRRTRAAWLLGFAALGAVAISERLKLMFQRPRPAAFFGYHEPSSYSYPSGHAITSLCFYSVLAVILTADVQSKARRCMVWVGTATFVALIGFSRIYLGAHYPTDVLGGYALGVVWTTAVLGTSGRWKP